MAKAATANPGLYRGEGRLSMGAPACQYNKNLDSKGTFSLAFLFRQMTCVATLLALVRLYPTSSDFDWVVHPVRSMAVEWLVLVMAGAVVGTFCGGFVTQAKRGSIIGVGIVAPCAFVWVVLRVLYHAIAANSV